MLGMSGSGQNSFWVHRVCLLSLAGAGLLPHHIASSRLRGHAPSCSPPGSGAPRLRQRGGWPHGTAMGEG